MGYYLASFGGSLYRITTAGVATALTLPAGVVLDTTRRARMAVLQKNTVLVNQGTRGLVIDANGDVFPMGLASPTTAPPVAGTLSGALSGTYRARYSHVVKDADGNLLAESPLSPISAQISLAAKQLTVQVEVSPESTVTHRRLYRTVSGGSVFFPWFDIEGNTLTQSSDDMSDTLLANITAPTELGPPPGSLPFTYMTLCVEWKGRLWGVGSINVDDLRYSGAGSVYGWPSSYDLPLAPLGADSFGITGIMPRRDELGVAKREIIWKITGDSPSNFEPIKVIEGKGCFSADSIKVIRDVAYFLGDDGVYTWGPDGVKCISDDKVRSWFASDTYFNRAQFPNAFAKYNARYHSYELHLANAGSSVIDRWVTYDITSGEWFGPHKTAAFTPQMAGEIFDANGISVPVLLGNDGKIYLENAVGLYGDNGVAIEFRMTTKAHTCDTPDITKLFEDWSLLNEAESSDGALSIACTIGDVSVNNTINPLATKTFYPALRDSRSRFGNIGPGRAVQLTFIEATLNQACGIYGYEIPNHELGRR